ncbi:hypothetical protein [Marinobacter sp.]|uniref:hypothetical protein n=1 Tax=Marinobacter sp. TaxID=50741 RepID=UPI00356AF15F
MEPIRPDDDELRVDAPFGGSEPEKQKPATKKRRPAKPPEDPESTRRSGNRGGGFALAWVLLGVVAVGAGVGWYLQEQRIQVLEGRLKDADNWARQSNLALARFEGELSETGESLQERGATFEQKIAAHDKRLSSVDGEIRKLWVIANERNKQRLDEQQQRLGVLDEKLAMTARSVSDLSVAVEQVRLGIAGDIAQLSEQLKSEVIALEQADQVAAGQLATLSQRVGEVGQLVDSRVRRFEQEQKLGVEGREGRISALEQAIDSMADDSDVRALRAQLAELKKTVAAIDASRAQLTSRLVRLSEEVNQLRSGSSGQ